MSGFFKVWFWSSIIAISSIALATPEARADRALYAENIDLGDVTSREVCMAEVQSALAAIRGQAWTVDEIVTGNNSAGAFGINGVSNFDVFMTCWDITGRNHWSVMLHSQSPPSRRDEMHNMVETAIQSLLR